MPDDKPIGATMDVEDAKRMLVEAWREKLWGAFPAGIHAHEVQKIEEALRGALEKLADSYKVEPVFDVKVSGDVNTGELWVDFHCSPEIFGMLGELGLVPRNQG